MIKNLFFLLLIGMTFHVQANTSQSSSSAQKIWFRYKDEPLINIVNDLATKRNINIMPPQETAALTSKITFELPHKISLERAWQYMITILDIAGFAIIPNTPLSFIIKKDQNTNKEILPLYIDVAPQDLPETDLIIRYLRYLTNLQVPNSSDGANSSLQMLLSQLLSPGASIIYEPQLNAVLITDSARSIKSVMTIIDELSACLPLQKPGFVQLKYTTASQVKMLLDQLIGQTNNNPSGEQQTPQKSSNNSSYFTKGTKSVADNAHNVLILLGKEEDIEKISNFIKEYIDLPPEKGRSILHIYDLQYLNSDTFAPILTQIVQDQVSNQSSAGYDGYGSGTDQSTSSNETSIYKKFQGVIITTEGSVAGTGDSGSSVAGGSQTGNRLIIAAVKDDWVRIEALIKELDKPQLQVVIHGLIIDLSYTGLKNFTSQIRNSKDLFLKDVNWQTGHFGHIENGTTSANTAPTDTNALMSNLLPLSSTNNSSGNIANGSTKGTCILSFKDTASNGIFLISSMLNQQTDSKILSRPFLTTLNNKEVYFKDSESRTIDGPASGLSGVQVVNREDVEASIDLKILPRINQNGIINLSITINVNEFETTASHTRTNRSLTTNVNIENKDVLVLGGLTKTKLEYTCSKTPLLGDIPFFGNLFKAKTKTVTKTHLMIFLRPEIIKPEDKKFAHHFLNQAQNLLEKGEENFSSLKDPISRWFFGTDPEETSSQVIKKIQGETESITHHIELLHRNKVSMPEPIDEDTVKVKYKINDENFAKKTPIIDQQPKHKKTSSREPLDAELQEKNTQKELKRLFALEDEVIQEKEKSKTQEIQSPHASENEEFQAAEELKQLFQDPELNREVTEEKMYFRN
jgi:general secretion pathway protein D